MVERDEHTAYIKVEIIKAGPNQQVKVYPKPVTNHIKVQTSHTEIIKVTNSYTIGNVVRTRKITTNGAMNSTPFAVSGLQRFLYRVVIQAKDKLKAGGIKKATTNDEEIDPAIKVYLLKHI